MNIPNRCKSTPKYLGMMLIYTIILSVIFNTYSTYGTTGKMIAVGLGVGIIVGVMREPKFWLSWKKAKKAAV